MDERVCLVTGANRGIGRATAEALARLPSTRVLMLGRDATSLDDARAAVARATKNARVEAVVCDLASQASIRDSCARLDATLPRLDLLVHNAAVMRAERHVTPDGIEQTFAINHLAPVLMTRLLMPTLRRSEAARVVVVTSGIFPESIPWDDLASERSYVPFEAYMRSKALELAWALDLGARLRGSNVTVNAAYPGPFVRTDANREVTGAFRWFLRLVPKISAKEAARRVVRVATSAELTGESGVWFDKKGPRAPPAIVTDAQTVRRMLEATDALV